MYLNQNRGKRVKKGGTKSEMENTGGLTGKNVNFSTLWAFL